MVFFAETLSPQLASPAHATCTLAVLLTLRTNPYAPVESVAPAYFTVTVALTASFVTPSFWEVAVIKQARLAPGAAVLRAFTLSVRSFVVPGARDPVE